MGATFRDLRIYEHPGTTAGSSLPLSRHVSHPDRHEYEHFAVDTPRACFLSWCPNSRSPTILPIPCTLARSWWILSRHGRLPTKDLPFHTHVIILFTEYPFHLLPRSNKQRNERRRGRRDGRKKKDTFSLSLSLFRVTKACVLVFYVVCTYIYAHAL